MKKSLTFLLAGLLIVAATVPAVAWEFALNGDFLWRYEYFTQSGDSGFFGPYNQGGPVAQTPGVNFMAMNAWVGSRQLQGGSNGVPFGLVTGQDASFNYQRTELWPEIRVNPAIRLRGEYQIAGPGGPLGAADTQYGVYQNSASFGAYNPISTGSWTQFWATVQTPWGILVFGKRGLGFGTGVQYVENSASSESLAVVAPYGPMRIGLGLYPHRRQTFVNAHQGGVVDTTVPGAFGGKGNISFFDGGTYPKQWDHASARNAQPFAFVTYEAGDLSAGVIYEWFYEHDGPSARAAQGPAAGASLTTVTRDETLEDGSVFVKYFNGRFFFNAEVAWVRGDIHYQLPQIITAPINPGDGSGSPYAPLAVESWKYGVEMGGVCGPTKLSLLFSYVPGPDRQHGIWINKQSWENVINGSFLGNSRYFRPYSFLMAYQYGAGLNAFDRNGEGYMTDAISYGARLDYAVAANLNFYGTFFYANRLSKGWGWGSLAPASIGSGPEVVLLGRQAPNAITAGNALVPAFNNGFATGAPSIPDDALGWEVDAGVDWKLLENFQFNLTAAYWEPGNWFKFACVDKLATNLVITNNLGGAATATNAILRGTNAGDFGVRPNKGIDAIYGLQGTMVINF